MALTPVQIVNAASGVFFIALGLWVWSVGRGSATNRAFALHDVAFGSFVILINLDLGGSGGPLTPLAVLLLALAAVGLAGLARSFPRPLAAGDRGRVAVAFGLGSWFFVAPAFAFATLGPLPGALPLLFLLSLYGLQAILWGFLLLLALRYREVEPAARPALLLGGGALSLYPAWWSGSILGWTVADASLAPLGFALAWLVPLPLLLAALWIRNGAHERGLGPHLVAWAILATATGALLAARPSLAAQDNVGFGLVRMLGALALAYGIVRHQLLGADVTVRWAIGKSTIAAVFVAVFFVASEGAQVFFGGSNPYFGVAAAGMLVFAIAPLQRAAERLAERAVPLAPAVAAPVEPPAPAPPRREETFRSAVRYTLRDRRLSRDEELHLARLAVDLGIAPDRAIELRHEVEAEVAPAGGPGG